MFMNNIYLMNFTIIRDIFDFVDQHRFKSDVFDQIWCQNMQIWAKIFHSIKPRKTFQSPYEFLDLALL